MHLGRFGSLLACCFGAWVTGMLATLGPSEGATFGQALVNGAYLAALIIVGWWAITHQRTIDWAKGIASKVEPWHLQFGGLVGVIVFACIALAGLIWEHYSSTPRGASTKAAAVSPSSTLEVAGPITWQFGSVNSPIGTSRSAGAPLWVDAFQIIGQNTSDGPVHARKAEIRSDISGQRLPLQFSHDGKLFEANTITIPPEGKFTLIGRIPATEPTRTLGVVVDQFREEFGAFTFTFEYGDPRYYYGDQTTFTRRFPWNEVETLLANADVRDRKRAEHNIIVRDAPPYASTSSSPPPPVSAPTAYDIEQKLKLVDAALGILRSDTINLINDARQLNDAWKSALASDGVNTFMETLAAFKSRASGEQFSALREKYRVYDDLSAILDHGNSNQLVDGVHALYLALKMTARSDQEWFINPYADKMREGVTELDNWRHETEDKLIKLRKGLSS